ncbi:MAG TPA: YlbF family regulator [Anaerolineae bacterium]|nr:YlbF family regulator [Anaerolineae bacterium]
MNDTLSMTLPADLLAAIEALVENLLRAEPIVHYHQAQARLEADQQAHSLLERLSAAQADLRKRQSRGMLTQADVDNLRMLQRDAQANPVIMDYAEAQQAALACLPVVNQEISQLLGIDFASLAGPGSC